MASQSSGRQARALHAFSSYALLAGWGILIGAVIAGGAVLVPRLVERAAQAQPSAPIRVVLADEPNWLPSEDRRALELAVLKSLTGGPMDREGLQTALAAVGQSGWYDAVHQVRRPDMDVVVVEGTWAIPFALIGDAYGEHLIDTKGRLLPRTYAAGQGPLLLRIIGAAQPRPAQPGETWQGADVSAALQMAALMQDRPWRGQIVAIDVSSFAQDGIVRLRTERGCELLWGRTPGQESASEVPAHLKLAALQYLHDHHGRVDAGCEQVLDLRSDVIGAR